MAQIAKKRSLDWRSRSEVNEAGPYAGVTAANQARPRHMHTVLAVLVLGILAAASMALSQLAPFALSDVLIALVLGLGLGQIHFAPSLRHAAGRLAPLLLKTGVGLLGARLSLAVILSIGADALLLIVGTMTGTFLLVWTIGTRLGLPKDLTTLLALGMAVCGNSAIATAAPIIGAQARHIGYAIATITIFGTTAVIAYPLLGTALAMPEPAFGVWSGISINDTSQVVAAGAAYSGSALLVATVVKLVRNAMIAPAVVALVWRYRSQAPTSPWSLALKAFPLFVVAFLGLATLRTLGLISDQAEEIAAGISGPFITAAIAGIGYSSRVEDVVKVGVGPLVLGVGAGLTVSLFTLLLILVAGIGW